MLKINTRILSKRTTGVQRYLKKIINNHSGFDTVCDNRYFQGHIWEQALLPNLLSKSDVLWSPSNTGPLYCKAAHVVTIHDFATLDHPEWTSRKFSTFYRFLLPKLVKRCDAIIAISEYTKSRIMYHSNVCEDKIHVIRNGVDEEFFDKPSIDDSLVLSKYYIPTKRYVLSVSSIEPRKNLKSLLLAWNKIVNVIDDDIYLILVGVSNPKIFADLNLTNLPPRVHFTGFVDDNDLSVIYHNALLFCYVSFYEGFGLPPLEAMAAGVPVITSNATSIPEVVGDKAVTLSPDAIDDIAENIINILGDESLRTRMGLAGISHAKNFSWNDTATRTFELLKSFE